MKEENINLNLNSKTNQNYFLNISKNNLLKDNQIPNSNNISTKILNNFCSSLHKAEMEINSKKKCSEKIFRANIEVNRLKNDENWTCFVCNNGILEDNDIFYECEKCKISVHQNCYGILTNNSENWLCDACALMSKEEAENLECVLCPVRGGAMKRVLLPENCQFLKNLKKIRKNEFDLEKNTYNSVCIIPKEDSDLSKTKRAWAHLSCVLWNPDIEIKESQEDTKIKFVDCLPYSKFLEKCEICGKIGYGPTIKCNEENCNFRCHPECGRINGYRLEIENKTKNGFLNFNMYCFAHQPVKLGKVIEKFYKNIFKTLLGKFISDSNQTKPALDIYNEQITYFAEKKLAFGALLAWYLIAETTMISESKKSAIDIAQKALENDIKEANNGKASALFAFEGKTAQEVADIKKELKSLRTIRARLQSEIAAIQKLDTKERVTETELNVLQSYFPNINLKKIEEISLFHKSQNPKTSIFYSFHLKKNEVTRV